MHTITLLALFKLPMTALPFAFIPSRPPSPPLYHALLCFFSFLASNLAQILLHNVKESLVALYFEGEIYSSPTARSFHFEYEFDGRETKSAFLGYSVVFNCTTNDPSADVRLAKLLLANGQANLLSEGGRLTRRGPVFTIRDLIWKDAGRYKCVAVKDGREISREIDLVLDNPGL